MKKTILLLLTIVFFVFIGFSQDNKVAADKQEKKIEKTIIITTDDEGQENVMVNGDGPKCSHEMSMGKCDGSMCGGDKDMMNDDCGGKCQKHMKFMRNKDCKMNMNKPPRLLHMSPARKAFALMPVILFLFVFLIFLFWLRKENYKLSDALSSKSPEILKTTHTRTDPADPTKTITETKEEIFYPRSASKLIAFFTALAGIVVVICGLSFHAYTMLSGIGMGGEKHHGGGLIFIVMVLFVGMLPYVFRVMFKK